MPSSFDRAYIRQVLSADAPAPMVGELRAEARRIADTSPRIGRRVVVRGLIEITNICRNGCLYCGIRAGNPAVGARYALSPDEILDCCRRAHQAGMRTFVLQGGENPALTASWVETLVQRIAAEFPDAAITLSLGEWPDEALARFRAAGASRYLLRHETRSADHYRRLHPAEMSLDNRLRCLRSLKRLGYQTGTGIMVGSPFQTLDNIIDDIDFMLELQPEMIGIGPFIPAQGTPLAAEPAGSVELTLRLISLLRILFPDANIPATTAIATLQPEGGRIAAIQAGANVVMPNVSPQSARSAYRLYDQKAASGLESIDGLRQLAVELAQNGYSLSLERGDAPLKPINI